MVYVVWRKTINKPKEIKTERRGESDPKVCLQVHTPYFPAYRDLVFQKINLSETIASAFESQIVKEPFNHKNIMFLFLKKNAKT